MPSKPVLRLVEDSEAAFSNTVYLRDFDAIHIAARRKQIVRNVIMLLIGGELYIALIRTH